MANYRDDDIVIFLELEETEWSYIRTRIKFRTAQMAVIEPVSIAVRRRRDNMAFVLRKTLSLCQSTTKIIIAMLISHMLV